MVGLALVVERQYCANLSTLFHMFLL